MQSAHCLVVVLFLTARNTPKKNVLFHWNKIIMHLKKKTTVSGNLKQKTLEIKMGIIYYSNFGQKPFCEGKDVQNKAASKVTEWGTRLDVSWFGSVATEMSWLQQHSVSISVAVRVWTGVWRLFVDLFTAVSQLSDNIPSSTNTLIYICKSFLYKYYFCISFRFFALLHSSLCTVHAAGTEQVSPMRDK